MRRFKTLIRFSFASLLLLFLLSASPLSHQAATSAAQINEGPHTGEDDPMLTAIVVVKAASGASYMDDRDYIATMPELTTMEDVHQFVSRYEPDPGDMQMVRGYLEKQGFRIAVQDNMFLKIFASRSKFDSILVDRAEGIFSQSKSLSLVRSEDLDGNSSTSLNSVEGLLVDSLSSNPTSSISYPVNHTRTAGGKIYEPDDIAKSLNVDHIRETGLGVNIGFVDTGVHPSHKFFEDYPIYYSRFKIKNDQPVSGSNFSIFNINGHGTMVASFLATTAPDATLISFGRTPNADLQTRTEELLSYLIYMNQQDFVDVLSLSVGPPEEHSSVDRLPEIRTAILQLIADNTISLAAAGNVGKSVEDCDSGHNSVAAIPEIIAVGGADLDFSAAGGYNIEEDGSKGSASFSSALYPGRKVPDVVGIFGVGSNSSHEMKAPAPLPFRMNNFISTSNFGTSGATPQIAGIVALLKQRDPSLNQIQVRSILENAAYDVRSGESGDGHSATGGYDLATGYGLPLADRVMTERFPLYPGWNLIGLTKDRGDNYTADDFMQEIREQNDGEWTCDTVTRRIRGRYESRIIKVIDGEVRKFGFNFELHPEEAYFVRCDGTWWEKPDAPDHIDMPQTITFEQGWNFFSIPYSEAPCTVEDLFDEVSEGGEPLCDRVVKYDGRFQEVRPKPSDATQTLGENFPFVSGRGYIARCYGIQAGESHGWTPNCQDENSSTADYRTSSNTYAPNPKASTRLNSAVSQATSISAKGENSGTLEVDLISKMVQHSRSDEGALASPGSMERLPSTGTPAHEILEPSGGGSPCQPQEVYLSNLTDRTFSISWLTSVPCIGSLVIMVDGDPVFQAFDDRGIRFSGTTHHVTLQGLHPEATYQFGLLSGDVWDGLYQVTTGARLDMPTNNFSVYGQVADVNTSRTSDVIAYAQLGDGEETSTLLSSPVNASTDGYAITLDNARTTDATAYFDYTAADHLYVLADGGSAGVSGEVRSIDLSAEPNVAASLFTLDDTVPEKPTAKTPAGHIISLRPTFRFDTLDGSGNALTYRLELSTDNFATVARVYDQRYSLAGWSAASYASGEEVHFTIPDELENLLPYQWRVFAYNGQTWSAPSDITTFSIARYFDLYLPLVLSND